MTPCTYSSTPTRNKVIWGQRRKAVWGSKRHKAVWGPKRALALAAILSISLVGSAAAEGNHDRHPAQRDKFGVAQAFVARPKLDSTLSDKLKTSTKDTVSAVVMLQAGAELPDQFRRYVSGRKIRIINGYALNNVPVGQLTALALHANIHRVYSNRATAKHDALSSAAVYANAYDAKNQINNQFYGYTGAGVTVAFIDSGFTGYPTADLLNARVRFVDIMNGGTVATPWSHDENGHGTHVAGIVGGTGALSDKKYAGIAPGANILSLKVLDENGTGTIADILKAMDWIYTHPEAGVRVVNMSVGAAVTESYWTDPLTLATKVLVDRGITVVAAAGNNGLNKKGQPQYGGVAAPGNAPWVLTVCAFSTKGTYNNADDAVAGFSSSSRRTTR